MDINPGDRVRYRVGRGYGEGRAANVSAGKVLINTSGGKSISRKLSAVQKIPDAPLPEPCGQAQAATASGNGDQ